MRSFILKTIGYCSLFVLGTITGMSGQSAVHSGIYVVALGTVQDAGSPHLGCEKSCCKGLHQMPDPTRMVVCLGIIDPVAKKTWLIDATPDITSQLHVLQKASGFKPTAVPDGIFLTHAHIGHYTGLMYFGKEGLGADSVPVHVMPKMKAFLETNGPWSQLVELNNISLNEMTADTSIQLSESLTITPFVVPHRDEFSETVGFSLRGPDKSLLFIPDINKWEKWDRDIIEVVNKHDFALIDATFYDENELPDRSMSEIPHPFVVESMKLFDEQPASFKSKIHFIHLNHTNPLLNRQSPQAGEVLKKGYKISKPVETYRL